MTTPKDAVLSIRLPAEDRDALAKIADENDEPIAQTARRAIRAFLGLGVAVLAVLTLGACGGSDSPAAERSAPAATTAPVAVEEPTAECWTGGYVWLDRYNNLTVNPVAAVAFLETLPSPSEGCTEADSAALQNAQDKILDTRERFPDLF